MTGAPATLQTTLILSSCRGPIVGCDSYRHCTLSTSTKTPRSTCRPALLNGTRPPHVFHVPILQQIHPASKAKREVLLDHCVRSSIGRRSSAPFPNMLFEVIFHNQGVLLVFPTLPLFFKPTMALDSSPEFKKARKNLNREIN